MSKIPWCVILLMANDQGRLLDKKSTDEDEGEIIDNEKEELEFLGLA